MSIENITNTVTDEKKLSAIEKHPLAFFIIVLFISVLGLSYLYVALEHDFRYHLTTANKVMIEALKENTDALRRFVK